MPEFIRQDPVPPDLPSDLESAAADGQVAPGSVDAVPPAGAAGPPELERRQFVRKMTTDAVGMAGRLVGFSRVITRSATAAGQAMISELGSIQAAGSEPDAGATGEAAAGGAAVAGAVVDDAAVGDAAVGGGTADDSQPAAVRFEATPAVFDPPPPPIPNPSAPPGPEEVRRRVAPDAEQSVVLAAATRAIVAVNRAGFAPQLTAANILWDGDVIRFPTLGWSRRTTQLRADPKIGLLIDDADAGVFLAVSGRAKILEGHDLRAAMEPLLRREASDPEDAERRWQAMLAEDRDRAVIVVELDQVLTGRR